MTVQSICHNFLYLTTNPSLQQPQLYSVFNSRLPSQFRVILVHNKEQTLRHFVYSQIISNALPTPLTYSKFYASISYLRINSVSTQRIFFVTAITRLMNRLDQLLHSVYPACTFHLNSNVVLILLTTVGSKRCTSCRTSFVIRYLFPQITAFSSSREACVQFTLLTRSV